MNSKKEKFIKFNETVINGKKRNVYKKNSLKSKTLYIKCNNEYKKIKNDNIKKNGGGLLDFLKKKLGFSVDKIDLFTKEDYDKYGIIYNIKYGEIDSEVYNQINSKNLNSFSSKYQSFYVCNNFFLNFLEEKHFNAFKRRFESNAEINKFLSKCDEKLKAFILGLLTFENFKNINFNSSDELKAFRLLFFITFIFNDFNYYLNTANMPKFIEYFSNKLPQDFIDNYWDTDSLIGYNKETYLSLAKNYSSQDSSYSNKERTIINLLCRKYSNIENATKYDELVEYS
jgi:hypothetical protein